MTHQKRLVIVTGMSGAGKRHVLQLFEDLGHDCVDNLPAALIPALGELMASSTVPHQRMVVFVDARSGADLLNLPDYLDTVAKLGFRPETLFLDTSDEVIQHWYSESRRRHPVSPGGSIEEGIRLEREWLEPIRERADLYVDTSTISASELRERIAALFSSIREPGSLTISVTSFGFKYGLPPEADLVFDVRFLPNPHHDEELRPLSGLEPAVREYVVNNEEAQTFLRHMNGMIKFLIPLYEAEPKAYLTMAIGCTGGRHRSVAVSSEIARLLRDLNYDVRLRHRDVDREEQE
ncbi:MAG: RNase adapter RapZ [Candidatus Hydrogenedentes bacterium]|nr:RNase adapter RapZ [Candidatus Hydrogenedentota bacterium]